jgi:hypothetical protein
MEAAEGQRRLVDSLAVAVGNRDPRAHAAGAVAAEEAAGAVAVSGEVEVSAVAEDEDSSRILRESF